MEGPHPMKPEMPVAKRSSSKFIIAPNATADLDVQTDEPVTPPIVKLAKLAALPHRIQFSKLSNEKRELLDQCARLAFIEYRPLLARPPPCEYTFVGVIEASEETVRTSKGVEGENYTIVFQLESSVHGEVNVEARLCVTTYQIKLIHLRTTKPYKGDWESGIYCIPIESSADMSLPQIQQPTKSSKKFEKGNKSKSQIRRQLAQYASRSPKSIDVELVLDKLSKKEKKVLDDCSNLALLDHNIQNDADFRLANIEKAILQEDYRGCTYWIIFEALSEKTNDTATFVGVVWDSYFSRHVERCRTIRPAGNWYLGTFVVPSARIGSSMAPI